jgi:hypothetical protein
MAVELTQHFKGGAALTAADFRPAFLVVAAISACSVLIFMRLSPHAGAEMANRPPNPAESAGQAAG